MLGGLPSRAAGRDARGHGPRVAPYEFLAQVWRGNRAEFHRNPGWVWYTGDDVPCAPAREHFKPRILKKRVTRK